MLRTAKRLLLPLSGLFTWTAQFTLIYGVTAIACARGYAESSVLGFGIVPFAILATTAAALALTGLVLVRALAARGRAEGGIPSTDRFLNHLTILIGILSLVTIAWHGIPALIVPPCW